jgi:hypothetical protein
MQEAVMDLDRQSVIKKLGGRDAVRRMSSEAKADALEEQLQQQLNHFVGLTESSPETLHRYPTAAEVEAEIETRDFRQGIGNLFHGHGSHVSKLQRMPAKPTLADFFKLRFHETGNHVLQSANLAMKSGMSEEVVLACLLHDVAQELIRVDHGWWAAQIFEPYVPEKTVFAIRYHQALRFYPDPAFGYEYPELYLKVFGEDYKPEPYIEATYKMVRKHSWYDLARMVTVNDLYAFEPGVVVELDQFTDLLGRHFRQPEEGLGFDNTPVAHIWRSIALPDRPL